MSVLSIFGCTHKRTTFPQGKADRCHVACLDCGREFAYNWENMRIGRELPRVELPANGGLANGPSFN